MVAKRVFSVALCLFVALAVPVLFWFFAYPQPSSIPDIALSETSFFASIILFGLVAVEFVSAIFIGDSTYHTVLFAASLLAASLFSPSMGALYASWGGSFILSSTYAAISSAFLFASLFAGGMFLDYTYRLFSKWKKARWIRLALYAALLASLAVLAPFGLAHYAYLAAALMGVIDYAVIFVLTVRKKKDDLTFLLSLLIFSCAIGLLAYYGLSYLTASDSLDPSTVLSPFYFFLASVLFLSVYIVFIIRTDRKARAAERLELEHSKIRLRVLREQIKPHFIFNSLNAIRAVYHTSVERGDEGIDIFARYLRSSIDGMDKELVPFETEIDTVLTFIDLTNLGVEHPFEIVLDIDYSDFQIPPLTIGTFVENCVKHSAVNERPDGLIEISSHLVGDVIKIEITDNGKGFDPGSKRAPSVGIQNCAERLSLSMESTVEVRSKPGEGTTVTIAIPKGGAS